MNVYDINPYIRVAKYHTIHDWDIEPRTILDYELLYCRGGQCTLDYGDRSYRVSDNDIVLICPGVEHAIRNTSEFVQPHIHFDIRYDEYSDIRFICFCREQYLNPFERSLIQNNVFYKGYHSPIITVNDNALFSDLFFEVIDSFRTNYTLARADMLRLIEMIAVCNFPDAFQQTVASGSLASSVKHYINQNISRSLSLDELEKQFGYNKFYISKEFKQEYGASVMSYHKEKRMNLACEMLKSHSVSEVSDILGFSSVFVFSRAFKNHFGFSPTSLKEPLNKSRYADAAAIFSSDDTN